MPMFLRSNVVNAAIFSLNAVNAVICPVKRLYRHYFLGQIRLTPLVFWLNAVKAAIYPVGRC